jgi:serine/threonine protein kinase
MARIGDVLSGRYAIVGELGRGGMGAVFLARDKLLDREVAVKTVTASVHDAEARERFVREARVVAKLDHPNIMPLHDLGDHEGQLSVGKSRGDRLDSDRLDTTTSSHVQRAARTTGGSVNGIARGGPTPARPEVHAAGRGRSMIPGP